MSSKNNNKLNIPEARAAMDKFKMEAANEVGVNLKEGYNGHLTSREAGSVGGQMVKKMIESYEKNLYTHHVHKPPERAAQPPPSGGLFQILYSREPPLTESPPAGSGLLQFLLPQTAQLAHVRLRQHHRIASGQQRDNAPIPPAVFRIAQQILQEFLRHSGQLLIRQHFVYASFRRYGVSLPDFSLIIQSNDKNFNGFLPFFVNFPHGRAQGNRSPRSMPGIFADKGEKLWYTGDTTS